jgi:hypothetical protein
MGVLFDEGTSSWFMGEISKDSIFRKKSDTFRIQHPVRLAGNFSKK